MVTLFYLLLLISIIFALGYPLLFRRYAGKMNIDPEQELRELIGKRELTLASIKDTEFEYRMGKLSKADYDELMSRFRSEAVSLMKRIDLIKQSHRTTLIRNEKMLVTTYQADRKAPPDTAADGHQPESVVFCDSCGASLKDVDRYCHSCGETIFTELVPGVSD